MANVRQLELDAAAKEADLRRGGSKNEDDSGGEDEEDGWMEDYANAGHNWL